MKHKFAMLAVALSVGLVPSFVSAQAKPDPIKEAIKARQGLMQLQKLSRGMLNAVVKGEAPMNDAALQAAENLAALPKMIPLVFPKGSDMDAQEGTNAKPDIWAKPDAFKSRYETLQKETAKLAQVAAAKDSKKLADQLKLVADACTACHDEFRRDPTKK